MGLVITFVLGVFIVAGAEITRLTKNDKRVVQLSIAIAFGTLSSLAVVDLLPEALENLGTGHISVLIAGIAGGVLILKLLDRFIPDHDNVHGTEHECTDKNVIHIGIISTIAVTLHNIIEGMAVFSIAEESVSSGLLMALGVGLHNIPMGMIIFSTLVTERRSRRNEMLALASGSTFVGGLIMHMLWGSVNQFIVGILMALTLGMIVYIVLFELVPHLLHEKDRRLSVIGTLAGVAVIVVSMMIE